MIKRRRHGQPTLCDLADAAARLPHPSDYFTGRRRSELDLPDNLLLFCRRSIRELRDGTLQPHFHHRWVLLLPLRGSGEVLVDENTFRLRPGTALLLPPLRLHRYRNVTRGPICWLFITFESPGRDARIALPEWGCLGTAARRLLGEILQTWAEPQTTLELNSRLAAAVALLLLNLRNTAVFPAARTPSTAADLLKRINSWIAENQNEPPRLHRMATDLGISESHLRATFRQQLGLSLGRYVRETRCRLAALHLQGGTRSVTEAASVCGFTSVYSFSRTFKRVLGAPPRAFAAVSKKKSGESHEKTSRWWSGGSV